MSDNALPVVAPDAWYARVPKIELHLHLEGAIPHEALWQLVQRYGDDDAPKTLEALQARYQYRDFAHFIDTWMWQVDFLRSYDDFRLIAEAVARDLRAQNIRYVEAFYSPADFARHGLEIPELTAAIRRGLDAVEGIEVALVADLIRDLGPDRGMRQLDALAEVRDLGVIGIGIGGSEQSYPPEPFHAVYERARHLGFHTSAHAGEAAGAESVWGALDTLRVERIGHGTRAEEDPALIERLVAEQIPLEICPISNLRTGVVDSLAAHPVGRYVAQGLNVTINSDDPSMFGNSLAQEYAVLETIQGLSRDTIRALILNGIAASWMSPQRKAELTAAFESDPNWPTSAARPHIWRGA